MKKSLLLSAATLICCTAHSQQNYLDNYLSGTVTYSTIANSSNQILLPRDLDFKPNTNELWVVNRGSSGSSTVTIFNAGLSNQTTIYRQDSHVGHFWNTGSALAFSDIGEFASASEYQQGTGTFQGPALWSSDMDIYAKVFQNNWVSGLPLGSHLDMLHQSPYTMGIAHDSNKIYWVFDGYNGNICKYDYVSDHGPGYDDHSAGKIWRYSGVKVTRVPNVPSHMVKDKSSGWLYFIDGAGKRLKRLNTNTGSVVGTLTPPASGSELLSGYYNMGSTATVETIETFPTQPCGVDYYNNRLIVSDYTNGNITIYNTTTTLPTKLGTISTGQAGIMGVKIGPDGKIWFVNYAQNTVVRMDPQSPSSDDACIQNITAPILNDYERNYYSPKFNECSSTISPIVTLLNNGSNALSTVMINYKVDNGSVNTFNWTGSLASATTTSVELPAIAVSAGTHKLTVYASNPNGNADPNPGNDTKEGSFRTVNTASFPFAESFSSATFPPAGWDVMGFNKYCNFSRVGYVGGFGTNTGCAKMTYKVSQTENHSGQIDYLMMPRIDLTTAPAAETVMEFSVAYARRSSSTNDNLKVQVSTNCGSTWTTIYNKSGSILSTAPTITSSFTPNATQWRKESISLNSYIGQQAIFMFVTTSGNGNNLYIDDINITAPGMGIDENDFTTSISIYPNPASEYVTIEGKNGALLNAKVSLNNIVGEEIISMNSRSNYVNLDLSSYSNGVYCLNICTSEGRVMKKIVVNK